MCTRGRPEYQSALLIQLLQSNTIFLVFGPLSQRRNFLARSVDLRKPSRLLGDHGNVILKHIHDKVDRAILLCDLLLSIKDHVKNEEHLEKFEIERNALPKVGMPMLNTRFFGQMDAVIKDFLMPVMLGKQRSQMNQSVCYDANRVIEWQQLMEASNFDFCASSICDFVIKSYF